MEGAPEQNQPPAEMQGMTAAEKSLADVKKRRKDIDRDAQLLANRIALLKQEEMKTWRKIEETKKRTNDISGLKKRKAEKVQKKIFDIQLDNEQKRQMSQ